jgi:hypothetical protein
MGFLAVVLAVFGGGAGGVEVAERGEVETRVSPVIGENLLEAELRFAVRVDRNLGMIFGNRNGVRLTIGRGSRGEDQLFDVVANHGVEKVYPAGDVGGVKGAGLANGFGDQSFRGEVHDGVNFMLQKDFVELRARGEVNVAKNGATGKGRAVAFLEIVERDDPVTASKKHFGANAAYITGCAGN